MIMHVRRTSSDTWEVSNDGGRFCTVRTLVRPDGRCFIRFPAERQDSWPALADRVQADVGRDLYVNTDEADTASVARLISSGFVQNRREQRWIIPIDSARVVTAVPSDAIRLIKGDAVDLDRLRGLDDTIRNDIPGTDGWCSSREEFADSSVNDSEFDPELYLVAEHRRTGEYVGLVRVWVKATGPRLGCVGVTSGSRRTRVARDLINAVIEVLAARGYEHLVTETDTNNYASFGLASHHGGVKAGIGLEMIRTP